MNHQDLLWLLELIYQDTEIYCISTEIYVDIRITANAIVWLLSSK